MPAVAKGFDLRSGSQQVTVPKDLAGFNYTITRAFPVSFDCYHTGLMLCTQTVYGDSGNVSPAFHIVS